MLSSYNQGQLTYDSKPRAQKISLLLPLWTIQEHQSEPGLGARRCKDYERRDLTGERMMIMMVIINNSNNVIVNIYTAL